METQFLIINNVIFLFRLIELVIHSSTSYTWKSKKKETSYSLSMSKFPVVLYENIKKWSMKCICIFLFKQQSLNPELFSNTEIDGITLMEYGMLLEKEHI